MSLIHVEHASKKFIIGGNEAIALKDVSLTVETGEFIAIVGQSGSGKSTLLSILGFLDRPTSGVYRFEDRSIQELSDDELAKILNFNLSFNPEATNQKMQGNSIDVVLKSDLMDYMPGDILVKTDRASMAHGLELRSPFLDWEFASFCITIPSRLKITQSEHKYILRQAYQNLWTEDIRTRGKQGFGAPVHEWLKEEQFTQLKNIYLNDSRKKIFKLFSFPNTREYVQRNNYLAWILLTLSIWMEKHEYDFEL